MPPLAKKRRIGIRKADHHHAPLHPQATDKKAASKTQHGQNSIHDLPESSPEPEPAAAGFAVHIKAPISKPSWSPESVQYSPTNGTSIFNAFDSGGGNRWNQRTYSSRQAANLGNIHQTGPGGSPSWTQSRDQKDVKNRRGAGASTPTAGLSGRVKKGPSSLSKSSQEPPPVQTKPRREFRAPSNVERPEDGNSAPIDKALGKNISKGGVSAATKSRATFRAPSKLQEVAISLLSEDQTALLQLSGDHKVRSSTSSRLSSPRSTSSTNLIDSSCTSASQFQETYSKHVRASVSPDADVDDPIDSLCPICKAPVDPEQLDELRASLASQRSRNRKIVSEQTEFCRKHRQADATKEWQARGYPEIEWERLPSRLEQHRAALSGLLGGARRSWFRERLQSRLTDHREQSSRARDTLLQQFQKDADSVEDVGYYGSKGAAICMDFIASAFAPQLQKLRSKDPLIVACGGVAAYEQLVLLPELCTLLVAEDLRESRIKSAEKLGKGSRRRQKWKEIDAGPSEEELKMARETLRRSADLGRLLCEEENEEVLSTDSEDEAVEAI